MIEYLLRSTLGLQVASVIEGPDTPIHAPALCDIEVSSGLRRALRRNEITLERTAEVLTDLLQMPLHRHDHRLLLKRIIRLRENFSVYDATYVALAERLGATLVTCDTRLTRAAQRFVSLNVVGVR